MLRDALENAASCLLLAVLLCNSQQLGLSHHIGNLRLHLPLPQAELLIGAISERRLVCNSSRADLRWVWAGGHARHGTQGIIIALTAAMVAAPAPPGHEPGEKRGLGWV